MRKIVQTILLTSVIILLTSLLIKFPEEALEASVRGLNIWLEIVFPSLLPFFIMAELLIGFGVVRFIGIIFEPIMRPLFNVPGVGSFAWIMGMASGYPSGAKISVRLREEEQITQIEAERLISFTNASSPLFIFGAVAVGFFHNPNLGLLIAVCHYTGNALVGICMRFYRRSEEIAVKKQTNRISFINAFREMHRTRLRDKRPFGEVLGDAVLNSIQTLVMVGGFIILFSVLTKLLFLIGILSFLAIIFQHGLHMLAFPIELGLPLLSGLFEITLGTQLISQINTDLMAKTAIVSFILGFNGFSVQAQVSSIIAKTDIRFTPYFISRLMHGLFASILTILLFEPLYVNRQVATAPDIPVITNINDNYWLTILHIMKQYGPLITILFVSLSIIILYKRRMNKV